MSPSCRTYRKNYVFSVMSSNSYLITTAEDVILNRWLVMVVLWNLRLNYFQSIDWLRAKKIAINLQSLMSHHVGWVCVTVMLDIPFIKPSADNNITESLSEMIKCSSLSLSTDKYEDPLSEIRWFMHHAQRKQKGIALLILPSSLNRTLNDES